MYQQTYKKNLYTNNVLMNMFHTLAVPVAVCMGNSLDQKILHDADRF